MSIHVSKLYLPSIMPNSQAPLHASERPHDELEVGMNMQYPNSICAVADAVRYPSIHGHIQLLKNRRSD